MCLVLAAVQVVPDAPLVLLANRDEYYDRPSESPRDRGGDPSVVCGIDLRAGGTWLGRNAASVVAVLTNRRGAQDAARPSRGGIPLAALAARTAVDGVRRAADMAAATGPNPFSLLVADRVGAHFLAFDGPGVAPRIIELSPGFHTHTNTHDLDELSADVVLRAGPGAGPPFASASAGLDALRAISGSHGALDGTRVAPCVHSQGRGTVSSSLLVLGREPSHDRFHYAAGAPCVAAFERVSLAPPA